MGLRGEAAIVGVADYESIRKFTGERRFTVDQYADLSRQALADAGLTLGDVDGLVVSSIRESAMFAPATVSEYLGISVNFAEHIDLGGASAVGMVWRAAAAIELGICDVVLCALPGQPIPTNPVPRPVDPRRFFQSASPEFGSMQAEFDIPYGLVAQNAGYAMIAQRYRAEYGYDPRAMAKIAAEQRGNALKHPKAVFRDAPITIDDVLASKMVADPLHMLEIVMPVAGGGAVVVASKDIAQRSGKREAFVTGFGEHCTIKTPSYAAEMTVTPVGPASAIAFEMAGLTPADVDVTEIYDCYTITVLLTLEDAGFCSKGDGMRFANEVNFGYGGDFPMNTHGCQLGFGQAGAAGGMSQVIEAVRQVRHEAEADGRQVADCDTAFVTGTGGVMSEQSALILRGG